MILYKTRSTPTQGCTVSLGTRLNLLTVRYARQSTHTTNHMFVTCQQVWRIWKRTLQYTFSLDQILIVSSIQALAGIYLLHLPLRNTEQSTLKYLLTSVIENVWRYHRQFTIHDIPYDPSLAVGLAISFERNCTGNFPIGPPIPQPSSES
jgi:thiosulfate reductase cytochrome b subunit